MLLALLSISLNLAKIREMSRLSWGEEHKQGIYQEYLEKNRCSSITIRKIRKLYHRNSFSLILRIYAVSIY